MPSTLTAQQPGIGQLIERVVDGGERDRHLGQRRFLIEHFGGEMPCALAEQQPAERHALPGRAKADVPQHRLDVMPGAAVEDVAAKIDMIRLRSFGRGREDHGTRFSHRGTPKTDQNSSNIVAIAII